MKKNKINFIIIFILITIILTVMFILIKKTKQNKHNKIIKKSENLTDIKINKFRLQQIFENNDNKWILKAENGQIFLDQNTAKCTQSKVTFIKKNKKVATLHAPKTIFHFKKNRIEMEGGIKSKIVNF